MDEVAELFAVSNRKPRNLHRLDSSSGLYALYLNPGSALPGLRPNYDVPVYVGKADGAGGLARRCHFSGGTRNHSPRKSLAALLEKELDLRVLAFFNRTDKTFKTWGLPPSSEATLDRWMHENLLFSVVATQCAAALERPLIRQWAPCLNLTDCVRSESHQMVCELRAELTQRARTMG